MQDKNKYYSLIIIIFLFLFPLSINAENIPPLWELGIGVGGISMPDYRGCDHQQNYILPIPYFIYRGSFLKVDREKIRGLFFKSEWIELDFSVNGSPPVKSEDSEARKGMPDIDPTLELGPQANIILWKNDKYRLTMHLPLRQVFAVNFTNIQDKGITFNPGLNFDIKKIFNAKSNLGLYAGAMFSNWKYNQYFYGVEPININIKRHFYEASSGYSGMQINLSLSKRYDNMWFGSFFRIYDLHSAVFEDSPLVKNKISFMAGFGISWIITTSNKKSYINDK